MQDKSPKDDLDDDKPVKQNETPKSSASSSRLNDMSETDSNASPQLTSQMQNLKMSKSPSKNQTYSFKKDGDSIEILN